MWNTEVLTRRERVILNYNLLRPASAGYRTVPELLYRGALHKCVNTAKAKEDVDGCDNEPDEMAHPAG
jgi:hypothetical protein